MAKTNKGRKFFATTATAALVASAIVPVASAAQINDFNSISSYAQEAVQDLNDRGIIKGDQKGNFNPKSAITRAEAATILANALELEGSGSTSFTDVKKSAWYYEAIDAAVANGIFQGQGAGKFNPSANLTRSEAAIILVDAFGLEGSANLSTFKDSANVKSWAEEALSIAVANEVMKGDDKGNLNPNASITRQDFALMYYRTEAAEGTEEISGTVKAINNTTVEVLFTEEVTDIKALDFAIEGLDVTNAVVKQTNKKTVVLTTSAQTADVEYTVTVNGEKIGTFKGVSAVIPTAIDIVEKSQQSVVGNQVTVKAQVKVADGQSKAGIPVTFNIVNNASINTATLNQPIVAEAVTDENGVASYTYTRYAQTSNQIASADEVQAYATGKASLRSFAKVYWASVQPLVITEVTAGNAINNGGKKVYKVAAALNHAEAKTVGGVTKYYVNVGYVENVNVTPDKAVKEVTITDSKGKNLGYPGQFTTTVAGSNASTKEVEIELDAKGEATFTLTGSNAKVTPFVFVDQNSNPANAAGSLARFDETELVAKAPTVTFAKTQTLGLAVTAEGVEGAAAYATASTPNVYDSENTGGRTYTATLTNKDGKTAQSGTPVYVSVKYGTALNKNNELANVYLWDDNAETVTKLSYTNGSPNPVRLLTDKNGKVSFKLLGDKDSYATPTVYTETGDKGGLDSNDLQQTAGIVYFGDAVVNSANLLVNRKEASSVIVNNDAEFTYQTVDQNGNAYVSATDFVVSFEVSATFNTAQVSIGHGSFVTDYGAKPVGQGSTETFAVNSVGKSKGSIKVKAVSGTQVSVKASASQGTFPVLAANATFTNLNNEGVEAGQSVKGKVIAIDTKYNRILLSNSTGKEVYELSYSADELWVAGTGVTEATFEAQLQPGEELHFTQKTDSTKAKFDNLNIVSAVTLKADATIKIKEDRTTNQKVYDFGGQNLTFKELIVNSDNVVLKNGTINGTITTAYNVNDFGFDTFTHNGTFNHNYGDGNTLTLVKSALNVVNLRIAEHVTLDKDSTINELNLAVSGSTIDGEGTVKKLTKANSSIEFTQGKDVTIIEGGNTTPPVVNTFVFTTTEAISAGDVKVDGVKVGTVAATTNAGEFKVTFVEGKALPTADFKATIGDKEYDFKIADGKWVVTAVKEEGDKVVTGEDVKITFVEIGAGINAVRISKTDAEAAGLVVTEASTLVLTFADGTSVDVAYKADKGYFQNAAISKTEAEVKAAKVTLK